MCAMGIHRSQTEAPPSSRHSVLLSAKEKFKELSVPFFDTVHGVGHGNQDGMGAKAMTMPDSGYCSGTLSGDSDQPFFNKGDRYQGEPQNDDEPRIFALVIGIDKYASEDVPPLHGCGNDAEDFIRLLVDDLGVPQGHITALFNEGATRSSIINSFKDHLWWNPDIKRGDALLLYYSGHGASAAAPEGWAAERKQIEILCPHDYDPKRDVHGIPDYTLDALIHTLKDYKGDNIIAILDCCHSGGMDREQLSGGERVRGIRDLPDAKPLPPTLDHNILFPPVHKAMVSLEYPFVPYKTRATHVTLAACSSQEKAKEKLCTLTRVAGDAPVTETRGVFSVNLISMLRTLGRDGMRGWSYSHLMTELSRRGSFSECLPSLRLSGQNPECKGAHKTHAFFSKGGPVDVPDSFTLIKDGNTWHVQAGAVHGIVPGTEFGLTQTAMQRMGYRAMDVILHATDVEALACRVDSNYPLPDTLDHSCVVVIRWGSANPFLTTVSIRGAKSTSLDPELSIRRAASRDELYHRVVSENNPHDLLVDISRESGTVGVSRIERRDYLVATFCSSTRVRDLAAQSAALPPTRVLNAISRFNFHLYRLNTAKRIDDDLKVDVLFHVVERALAEGSRYRVRPDMDPTAYYEDILHSAATFMAKHRRGDTLHNSEVSGGTGSNITITKPVREIVLKPIDEHFYGFTLVNNSNVDLFPYVFYFDPDTYAIKPVYISESATVAPLPRKSSLPIGHGGSPSEPMSINPLNSKTHLGFLKVFVTTRYVDLNIEQPAVFSPPAGRLPAVLGPHSRGARRVSIPTQDGWNAWVYVLTSKAAKKHAPR